MYHVIYVINVVRRLHLPFTLVIFSAVKYLASYNNDRVLTCNVVQSPTFLTDISNTTVEL
jgi:hypothetical protein